MTLNTNMPTSHYETLNCLILSTNKKCSHSTNWKTVNFNATRPWKTKYDIYLHRLMCSTLTGAIKLQKDCYLKEYFINPYLLFII